MLTALSHVNIVINFLGGYFLGLNMFLVPINISTFHFNSSKVFLQLLVPINFSITIFDPYFKVNFCIFLMILYKNV